MTVSGTFTIDGTAQDGATVTVIDQEASPPTVVGTATTATDGTWSVDVGYGTTVHCTIEYTDPDTGETYTVTSKPFVTHDDPDPAFWSEALHRYQFSEGTGTTLADTGSASTLSDATINGPTWTTESVHEGQALDFDGTDDYTRAANRTTFSGFTSGMTLLSWIRIPSDSNRRGLVCCYDTTNNERSWYLEHNGTNTLSVFTSADGSAYSQTDFEITNSQYGTWCRIGFRWTSGNVPEPFINGSAATVLSAGTAISSLYQTSAPLDFGRSTYSTARWHNGLMDDTMLWDRALTDQEISDDYAAYTV